MTYLMSVKHHGNAFQTNIREKWRHFDKSFFITVVFRMESVTSLEDAANYFHFWLDLWSIEFDFHPGT